MKEEGRTERQREGDGAVRARLPRFPLLLILVSLGLLVVVPFGTILLINRSAEVLQEVVEPALKAVADLQIELAIEVAAFRAFLIADAPMYRRQFGAARERRNEAIATLVSVKEHLAPNVQEALSHMEAVLDDYARIADGVFGGEITRDRYSREILAEQHVRFLAALESVAAIERELLAQEIGLVDRYRRTFLVGFVVEGLLVVAALVAAILVIGLARRYQSLARDLEQAVKEREEFLRREREGRRELERRQHELRRVTDSRSRLVRGLGHDLKNPLSAADGYLQLLLRPAKGELSAKTESQIDRARRSVHKALDLLDNLLEFARAETGEIQVEFEPLDPREILVETGEEYRAQAEKKGLLLLVHTGRMLPPLVSDRRRIGQILGNLLSNAVKYTERGRILVGAQLVHDGEPRLGMYVSDTGRGIAPEDRPQAFEESRRLTEEGEGAGIGLAFASLLARALGGSLELESEVGRGSTFTLWLPLLPPREVADDVQGAGRTPVER